MSVYKDGANWQDRILNHYPPASDGERYYKIVKPDGTVVAEAAKLELLNTVLPGNEGTPVNATNLNTVLAALGHVKQQYSEDKLQEPYLESLLAYMDFNSNLTPVVGSFTGENDGCSFSTGPHSGSGSLVGAGATTGVTLSDKVVPFGAKTVRFRLKMNSLAAQTLLDETSLSTANYGTCITIDAAGKIRVRLMQAGSTPVDITAGTAIKAGQWNDFCFAWDGSTEAGRVRLYLDGVQVAMGKASAQQDMGHAATNNTVLLNQAPLASSGGTAAMSDLEIYNEARYQDAWMLEQKGFSLFDGAKIRICFDYVPKAGTELLLNINESGYVPCDIEAPVVGQWVELLYDQSSKHFVMLQQASMIPVPTLTDEVLPGIEAAPNLINAITLSSSMAIKQVVISQRGTALDNAQFAWTKERDDTGVIFNAAHGLWIPASLANKLALVWVRQGTVARQSSPTAQRDSYYTHYAQWCRYKQSDNTVLNFGIATSKASGNNTTLTLNGGPQVFHIGAWPQPDGNSWSALEYISPVSRYTPTRDAGVSGFTMRYDNNTQQTWAYNAKYATLCALVTLIGNEYFNLQGSQRQGDSPNAGRGKYSGYTMGLLLLT